MSTVNDCFNYNYNYNYNELTVAGFLSTLMIQYFGKTMERTKARTADAISPDNWIILNR